MRTDHTTEIGFRAIIKSLPYSEKKALITKTNTHGIIRLVSHLALIVMMAMIYWRFDGLIAAAGLVGQGIGMCFLFCAMHEASHGTAFRSKGLNSAVMWLGGIILLMGPQWFRYFHFDHHRYTQDPEKDPELAGGKPENWRDYVFYLSGIGIWRSAIVTLVKNALYGPVHSYVPEAARGRIKKEARLLCAIYLCVISAWIVLAPISLWTYWLLPVIIGQPFLRLFLLAEHTGCAYTPEMLHNSRTIYTSKILLWLSWNMPYHSAHHSFPAVPFHQLPRFHAHIQDHIATTSQGYARFHKQVITAL